MEINNTFDVPLPPKDAWKLLLDIERIAPCMPGAELTGKADADTYNGKVAVKLGPVALSFAGQVRFTEIDEANHKARAKAQGKDSKGRGGANAIVSAAGSRFFAARIRLTSWAISSLRSARFLGKGKSASSLTLNCGKVSRCILPNLWINHHDTSREFRTPNTYSGFSRMLMMFIELRSLRKVSSVKDACMQSGGFDGICLTRILLVENRCQSRRGSLRWSPYFRYSPDQPM